MIHLTTAAIAEIRRIQVSDQEAREFHVRVMVTGGGKGTMNYKMGFDPRPPEPKDKVFEQDGVKLVVDPRSFLFLKGTEVDFFSGEAGQGFVFNNPNARSQATSGASETSDKTN